MKTSFVILALALAASLACADPKPHPRGPEFQRIESRVFESVRYDGAERVLTIVFANGAAYAYHDVPREVFLDFTRIVNKGEYFAKRIRPHFSATRVPLYPFAWANHEN